MSTTTAVARFLPKRPGSLTPVDPLTNTIVVDPATPTPFYDQVATEIGDPKLHRIPVDADSEDTRPQIGENLAKLAVTITVTSVRGTVHELAMWVDEAERLATMLIDRTERGDVIDATFTEWGGDDRYELGGIPAREAKRVAQRLRDAASGVRAFHASQGTTHRVGR